MPHFRLRRNWWIRLRLILRKENHKKIGGYSCRLSKLKKNRLMPNMHSGIQVTYLKQHVTTCLRSSSTNRDIHHCCLTFWSETATPYYNDSELSWSGFEHPIPCIRERVFAQETYTTVPATGVYFMWRRLFSNVL